MITRTTLDGVLRTQRTIDAHAFRVCLSLQYQDGTFNNDTSYAALARAWRRASHVRALSAACGRALIAVAE